MADIIYPGNASPSDVLGGKKFSAGTNYDKSGSMPNNGGPTLHPGDTITSGYYSGGNVTAVHGSQLFTTNGTFTVPSNVREIRVAIIGGGGSGSAYAGNATVTISGGNSGTCVYTDSISVTPGDTYSVGIGQGGSGVTSSGGATDGNAGTSSSFGSLITAAGGSGGSAGAASNASANSSSTSPSGSYTFFAWGTGDYYSGPYGRGFFYGNGNYGNGSYGAHSTGGSVTSQPGNNGACQVWW